MKIITNCAKAFPERARSLGAITLFVVSFLTTPLFAQTTVPSSYSTNVTWTLQGSPYVIPSTLTLQAGATLTVQAGVVVKFGITSNNIARLRVLTGAALVVNGFANQRVVFTTIDDDSVAGDTGGNGLTTGSAGRWADINVAGTATIAYADIRYGGSGFSSNTNGAVVIGNATVRLDHVSVRYNQQSGVVANSGSSTIQIVSSDFSYNATGIAVNNRAITIDKGTTLTHNNKGISVSNFNYTGMPMTLINSDVVDNTQYGLWIEVNGTSPVSSYPYGHHNNIYNNGAGADMRQLYPLYRISDADWTNNYWGAVQAVVPCPWAPATFYQQHLSYSASNPYSESVKAGPVRYSSHSKYDGQWSFCGSDWVMTAPYASTPFDNYLAAIPPRLTLYLDADPLAAPFNIDDPQSDDARYLPGADLSDLHVSVPLPQGMQLIAAYVDGFGTIVPPPAGVTEISFALQNTSKFKGFAMNAGDDDESPDYSLGASSSTFSDRTARVALTCLDYGGFTSITASDGSTTTEPIRLPKDDDHNWLPDIGWQAFTGPVADSWGTCATPETCDADQTPGVSGLPNEGKVGDGLTNFEEFRGFMVRGVHRRTDPGLKDVFISSTVLVGNVDYGILYAYPALPTATHRVFDEMDITPEYEPLTRVINFNYQNGGSGGSIVGHQTQSALRIIQAVNLFDDATGCAIMIGLWCDHPLNALPPAGPFRTPNETERLEIYSAKIENEANLANFSPEQRGYLYHSVIGHESGHGVNMIHNSDTANNGTSLMEQGVFAPSPTDERAQFNDTDKAQIRLHFHF